VLELLLLLRGLLQWVLAVLLRPHPWQSMLQQQGRADNVRVDACVCVLSFARVGSGVAPAGWGVCPKLGCATTGEAHSSALPVGLLRGLAWCAVPCSSFDSSAVPGRVARLGLLGCLPKAWSRKGKGKLARRSCPEVLCRGWHGVLCLNLAAAFGEQQHAAATAAG
jgi:hypothetical protein